MPDEPPGGGAMLLKGKPIADEIRTRVAHDVVAIKGGGGSLKLVAIAVGENEEAASYARMQQKAAEALGIDYELKQLPGDASQSQLAEEILALNADPAATGVILQMPVPDQIDRWAAQDLIAQRKDVDGVSAANLGSVLQNRWRLAPCTALAAMALIEASEREIKGAEAVIVGRSEIVGKPVALMLMQRHATPTICHTRTKDLAFHTRRADILVVAAGRPGVVTGAMIQPGALVVDVGINYVDGKMVGDVEAESAQAVAGILTPVPGGVGPVTAAVLMRNVVEARKWQSEG